MLVVISTAKNNTNILNDMLLSKPQFSKNAIELASIANELTMRELRNLMSLSDSLA